MLATVFGVVEGAATVVGVVVFVGLAGVVVVVSSGGGGVHG